MKNIIQTVIAVVLILLLFPWLALLFHEYLSWVCKFFPR